MFFRLRRTRAEAVCRPPPRENDIVSHHRYKQQIAEMEAAMKSTWEEKAKQSESSERERQRLQRQASVGGLPAVRALGTGEGCVCMNQYFVFVDMYFSTPTF